MRVSKRKFLCWWFGGIAAFAIAIWLHVPLITESVPGGIGDHQRAPDAATVNAIQTAWRADGLLGRARMAMFADLVFIGIYGIGCVLGGLYYRANEHLVLKIIGWTVLASGIVFLVTDYAETIAQVFQLLNFEGDDTLASLASTCRPPKMVSFIAAFIGLCLALVVERISSRAS